MGRSTPALAESVSMKRLSRRSEAMRPVLGSTAHFHGAGMAFARRFSVMDDKLDVRKHQGCRNFRVSFQEGNLYSMPS